MNDRKPPGTIRGKVNAAYKVYIRKVQKNKPSKKKNL